MPALRSTLTIEERAARHRLFVRDSLALSSLLTIVVALTFVTYLLFHSFADHRQELKLRWKTRGENALANHRPAVAIESLRSALAYAPDDSGLQIELAGALAAAGRTQEATVYFDTLHEAAPGDGMINLQLARLAATAGNVPLAISQYQAALDGTWNGDGFIRRRQVRLELSRYLIAQRRFDEARNQLLIAAGNAADNHALQLTVAGMLEQAEGDADAYNLYRKAMTFSDTRTAGLVGAGRTAAAQNRYLVARNLLQQATIQLDYPRLPEDERAAVSSLLGEAEAILGIFPAENLPLHARAVRVAHAVKVVRNQVAACASTSVTQALTRPQESTSTAIEKQTLPATGASQAPETGQPASPAKGALQSALTAVQRAGSTLAGVAPNPAPPPPAATEQTGNTGIAALSDRWLQLPPDALLERRMERDPALLESTLQLVYEMEKFEARREAQLSSNPGDQAPAGCVPPSRDAVLLLKIAAAPYEIEQQ